MGRAWTVEGLGGGCGILWLRSLSRSFSRRFSSSRERSFAGVPFACCFSRSCFCVARKHKHVTVSLSRPTGRSRYEMCPAEADSAR